ncbi:MAG: hypothetical protein IIY21_07610 [Clostridiales bacterium]|nr:hypothetical protein [Clostridiales bacterium]
METRDLISRETAKLTLKNYGLNRYMLERMERWIDAQPAVDAVSVVRCKDCKYWIDNLTDEDDDEMYDACRWNWRRRIPSADDYCSYGERKESG